MAATGTPTPNIGLRIPLGTDPASVDDINYNSNLIDTKLGAVGSDSVQDQIDTLNSKFTFESVSSTTFDNEKLTEAVGYRNGNIVMVRVTIKAGLSTSWHNDVVTGLTSRYFPPTAIFGCHRVNSSADIGKNAICVLNTNGTIQFLSDQICNADMPFEFVFPASSL